jgi:hypothetical protein
MKTSSPYGPGMPVKMTPETVSSELSKDGGKAKARYPSGTLGIEPGGGGKTSGPFKRALTPGTSPTGS